MSAPARAIELGLRANAAQFALLVVVNGFVGAMVGIERSLLPLLARDEFHVASARGALAFLITFGLAKASANYATGYLAERVGRRQLLVLGWLLALPVPFMLRWAPSWSWVVAANLLLGLNQGLAWSATVVMKIDLVGPRRRGLALGVNEFAGYLAVALAALGGGYLAARIGTREALFAGGLSVAAIGLALSVLFVRDTGRHAAAEQELVRAGGGPLARDRAPNARLGTFAVRQAGFVNNLNDGLAWGLLPLYFAAAGLGVRQIGWLAAIYPAVWAVAQIGAGALSDRIGRRVLIATGMAVQGVALAALAVGRDFTQWAAAAALLGLGTAAVYPTLIAQASDLVSVAKRAGAVGTYRLWRDLGYVGGAVLAGVAADVVDARAAIGGVGAVTAVSGLVAWRLLRPDPIHD